MKSTWKGQHRFFPTSCCHKGTTKEKAEFPEENHLTLKVLINKHGRDGFSGHPTQKDLALTSRGPPTRRGEDKASGVAALNSHAFLRLFHIHDPLTSIPKGQDFFFPGPEACFRVVIAKHSPQGPHCFQLCGRGPYPQGVPEY